MKLISDIRNLIFAFANLTIVNIVKELANENSHTIDSNREHEEAIQFTSTTIIEIKKI